MMMQDSSIAANSFPPESFEICLYMISGDHGLCTTVLTWLPPTSRQDNVVLDLVIPLGSNPEAGVATCWFMKVLGACCNHIRFMRDARCFRTELGHLVVVKQ